MFILPSGVIARIETICRNFLWDGSTEYIRTPLVGWSKVCKPKSEGGLGLKDGLVWNKAALGKLLWWLYAKADHLWVKWVSHTYLKAQDWKIYDPTQDTSWYRRKVSEVRDLLIVPYLQRKNGITSLVKRTLLPKVTSTFDIKMTRSLGHLCQRIINRVEQWMGFSLPRDDMTDWRSNISGSRARKDAINGIINAMMYSIWYQRNRSKHEAMVVRPETMAAGIIKEMKIWTVEALMEKSAGILLEQVVGCLLDLTPARYT
ncbi:uncharacterized protein LOC141646410 [Silene latifolia]|uniref:uncharacterized protein LOC141646410 n=1 Tax=Silene latifolia TaxID=37657 RepID=UPI003D7861E1